mgnify:CR=1 FL=1
MPLHIMNITASMRKSLRIIAETPGLRPDAFARQYFDKDHPGWSRHTRCGHGTRKGGGLVLWAGGQIGKLRSAGLVTARNELTKAGREALQPNATDDRPSVRSI